MATLPTEIRRLLDQVRRDVRRHALWQPGQTVLLACSGGRDSMAALAILAELRPSLGHNLTIAHVDHGLQPNHAATLALVQAAAQDRGLPFSHRALALKRGPDLEERARTGRYRALAAMGRDRAAAVVATAHHADDQAETVLMRLARGAGADALCGVRRRREDGVVRPFLALTRAQLAVAAEHFAVDWLEDPSNQHVAATRNRLRHSVLPALAAAIPGAAAGLARSAALAAAHEGALAAWIDRALADHLALDAPSGTATVAQGALPREPSARAAALQRICRRLGVTQPSQRGVDQWLALGSKGTVALRDLTVTGDGLCWRFFVRNVAREGPAD